MNKFENKKVELFLDSGAYSAWTEGVSIDIDEYIEFIKKNKENIDIYANLDVIGIGGNQPNKLTAKKTLENQNYMGKAGLNPLPVFHYGEPFEYLKYYVENYDYLGLGTAGNSVTKVIPWLDYCFSEYICDGYGMPKIKIHGFAITSLKLMLRYPFYSADSSTWVITGRLGSIFVPRYKNGKWIYDENPYKISVSNRSPDQNKMGKHINTITPFEKKITLNYISEHGYKLGKSEFLFVDQDHKLSENEKWVGKKPRDKSIKREIEIMIEEGLCNKYELRDEINIQYFLDLEKSLPEWPWAFRIL